jgi:hypothetical protein
LGKGGWDSGGNKNSDGRLNYDHEHTKAATTTRPRTQTQQNESKTKLQRLKQVIGQRKVKKKSFFGFLWTVGNENKMNLKGNPNVYLTVNLNPDTT